MAEGYSRSETTYPSSYEKALEVIEAFKSGNIDIFEQALTKHGLDVKELYVGRTPLTIASFKGHLAEAKVLLENGANINEADKDGHSPLSASCLLGHSDVVAEFIKRGTDVNFQTIEKGSTPLMIASADNHLNTMKILIENGADVNAKDKQGWTALHYAANRNHKRALKILLQNGVDPSTTAVDGKTALDLAEEREIKDILIQAAENTLTREEADEGKRENYSSFTEDLVKNREKCDDEIEHLRGEKEKLLRAQRRVEESILSKLELSSEVGDGVVYLTIRIAQLESELRIKDREIAKLANSNKDAGTSETRGESSSAELTEETPGKLRERIERLTRDLRLLEKELEQTKAEKAAQSKELGRTKEDRDHFAKRVKTIEAEKEALIEELHELRERVTRKTATNVQQRIMILEMETRLKELKVSMEWNPETEKDELQ